MKRSNIGTVGLLVFVLLLLGSCSGKKAPVENKKASGPAKLSAGKAVPDFELPGLDGKSFRYLKDAAGKPVVLTFFASWCSACREEIPVLGGLHKRYAKQGLLVVGVNSGDPTEKAKRYAKEAGISYLVLSDPAGDVASGTFGLLGLPGNLVADRVGRIVYWGTALPKDIEKTVARLMKEP